MAVEFANFKPRMKSNFYCVIFLINHHTYNVYLGSQIYVYADISVPSKKIVNFLSEKAYTISLSPQRVKVIFDLAEEGMLAQVNAPTNPFPESITNYVRNRAKEAKTI